MAHANKHRRRSSPTRRFRTLGVVVSLGAVPLCSATPAHAGSGDSTAVVGPVLNLFGFGTSIGTPIFCGTASASLGSGFQELGAVEQGNPIVSAIDEGCAAFAQQGTTFVQQGKDAQAPFAAQVNPVANPVFEQLATAVTDFGATFEPALAPFGPTIAGSGNTIRFFAGSSPSGS